MHPTLSKTAAVSVAVLAVALAGAAAAATKTAANAPAKLPAKLPDWEGIWQKQANKNSNYDWHVPDMTQEHPPLTPKYQAIYDQRMADRAKGRATADPQANCVPPGMPRVIRQPYPREFVVTPHVVYILNEQDHAGTRRIFINGKHPPADELEPTYLGHSIGHWEKGGVLVVDTVGIRGDTVYDTTGIPHSDKLRVTERIWRKGQFMYDEATTIDPESLTKPWTITFEFKNMAPEGWHIDEYICSENNRNRADASGATGTGAKKP
jgi:hypothetical protein